jgi:hypothetical protein
MSGLSFACRRPDNGTLTGRSEYDRFGIVDVVVAVAAAAFICSRCNDAVSFSFLPFPCLLCPLTE